MLPHFLITYLFSITESHTIRACRHNYRTYREGEKFKQGESPCHMEECQCLSGHIICKPVCPRPFKIPRRPKNCRNAKKYVLKSDDKNCCTPSYEWRCDDPESSKKPVVSGETMLVSINEFATDEHYRSDSFPPKIRSTNKGKSAYRKKLLKRKQLLKKKNNGQMKKNYSRAKCKLFIKFTITFVLVQNCI